MLFKLKKSQQLLSTYYSISVQRGVMGEEKNERSRRRVSFLKNSYSHGVIDVINESHHSYKDIFYLIPKESPEDSLKCHGAPSLVSVE